METTVKQRFKELAQAMGWSLAFAEGYVDGETCKRRGMSPSKYVLVAADEYSLGFRAGYFQRQPPQTAPDESAWRAAAAAAENRG